MRIKICGITNKIDAIKSFELGAWAIGFIFYKKSPRYIDPLLAQEIIKSLPVNFFTFGVFVNENKENIKKIIKLTDIKYIQLHGDEKLDFCKYFYDSKQNVIKVFRFNKNDSNKFLNNNVNNNNNVSTNLNDSENDSINNSIHKNRFLFENNLDIKKIKEYSNYCKYILIDTYKRNQYGGTGIVTNWKVTKTIQKNNIPIILSGGLNIENISDAKKQVNPYAFDISSGVEKSAGIKDHNKLIEFFSFIKKL